MNASKCTTGKVTASVLASDISFSQLATGDFLSVKVPRKPQTASWNNAIRGMLEDASKGQAGYARIVYTILKGGKVWAAPTGDMVPVEVDRAGLHIDLAADVKEVAAVCRWL